MKANKILDGIFIICLMFITSSVACAELQGNLFKDSVVTVDGESFNIAEFDKAFEAGNIAEAEAIYNKWFTRRQEMLKGGIELGFFDMYIKHCKARILYAKENYAECIAAENEVLDYLLANLNESDDKNYNRFNLIHNSMRNKKNSNFDGDESHLSSFG